MGPRADANSSFNLTGGVGPNSTSIDGGVGVGYNSDASMSNGPPHPPAQLQQQQSHQSMSSANSAMIVESHAQTPPVVDQNGVPVMPYPGGVAPPGAPQMAPPAGP